MDVYDQLRELSKPHGEGEKAVSIIERTARMAGLSYSRCYEIYYRRARRIDADESERIGAALEQKNRLDVRNELSQLRLRLARLENILVQTDPDFHRPTSDFLRQSLRGSR